MQCAVRDAKNKGAGPTHQSAHVHLSCHELYLQFSHLHSKQPVPTSTPLQHTHSVPPKEYLSPCSPRQYPLPQIIRLCHHLSSHETPTPCYFPSLAVVCPQIDHCCNSLPDQLHKSQWGSALSSCRFFTLLASCSPVLPLYSLPSLFCWLLDTVTGILRAPYCLGKLAKSRQHLENHGLNNSFTLHKYTMALLDRAPYPAPTFMLDLKFVDYTEVV